MKNGLLTFVVLVIVLFFYHENTAFVFCSIFGGIVLIAMMFASDKSMEVPDLYGEAVKSVKNNHKFIKIYTNDNLKQFTGITANEIIFISDAQSVPVNLSFSAVRKCDLVIDNEIITSKSAGSALGRAIVGGVLLGGVGALAGAVTTSGRSKNIAKSISINLLTFDMEKPMYSIHFYPLPYGDVETATRLANEMLQVVEIGMDAIKQ